MRKELLVLVLSLFTIKESAAIGKPMVVETPDEIREKGVVGATMTLQRSALEGVALDISSVLDTMQSTMKASQKLVNVASGLDQVSHALTALVSIINKVDELEGLRNNVELLTRGEQYHKVLRDIDKLAEGTEFSRSIDTTELLGDNVMVVCPGLTCHTLKLHGTTVGSAVDMPSVRDACDRMNLLLSSQKELLELAKGTLVRELGEYQAKRNQSFDRIKDALKKVEDLQSGMSKN